MCKKKALVQKSICRSVTKVGRYPALLMAIIAFSMINAAIWLWIDTRPPRWDEAGYLNLSLKYHEALTTGGAGSFIRALIRLDRQRPTLVSALAVPGYLLFGRSTAAAMAVNVLAFVVLLLAVYRLGSRLVSPEAGVFAAFLVSSYPAVLSLSRVFVFDFWNTALVATSLYLLIRTERFSHKRASLGLGVVMGLGLLCRAFSPIFLIGPLAISLYAAWRTRTRRHERHEGEQPQAGLYWKHTLAAVLVVAGPWYVINLVPLTLRSLSATYGAEAVGFGPANPLTFRALLGYLLLFIEKQTTLVGLLLLLLALVILWRKRSSFRGRDGQTLNGARYHLWVLLSAVFLPYLFFTTLPSQDIKNITPILPAVALVSAWGLVLLSRSVLKYTLMGVSIVWFLFHFWLATYGWSALPPYIGMRIGENLPWLLFVRQGSAQADSPFFMSPQRKHWPLTEILSRVSGGTIGPNNVRILARPAVLAIIPNHPLFNGTNFTYFATLQGFPVTVVHPGDSRLPEGKEYQTQLLGVDFAVVKTGSPGSAWLNVYNKDMIAFLRSPESGFAEVAPRFPLPDGSEAIVFAANERPVLDLAPPMSFPTPLLFNDEIELLGYDLEEKGETSRGRAFLVTYYWRTLKDVTNDYRVFVHVTEKASSKVVANWDHDPARGRYPASWWRPGMIIKDRGLYFLSDTANMSEYVLRLGLYRPDTGARLTVSHAPTGLTVDSNNTWVAIGVVPGPTGNAS